MFVVKEGVETVHEDTWCFRSFDFLDIVPYAV